MLVAIGIAAGIAGALPALRFVASLLYGLSPRDPVTFLSAAGMLSIVAALAGIGPAWRASRVDPSVALRID
jgi:ABC-type antimicrobial peptide transport system permease subunit